MADDPVPLCDAVCDHKFDFARMAIWLSEQPQIVQDTARLFPIPQAIPLKQMTLYAVGYSQQGEVACLAIDPNLLTCDQFGVLVHHSRQFSLEYLMAELVRH